MKRAELTEDEWSQVFQLRCRAKQGQYLPPEALTLIEAAFKEDAKRYGAMEEGVFNATVPFGSDVRWSKKSRNAMKYLFLGDTHNSLAFAENAAKLSRRHGAEMIQLGDFGFLWPGNDQLQDLSDILTSLGVTLRFVCGNHDDHPRLRKYVSACVATTIAPHVIYQPRGSVHEDEDGTRFLFCGGAPSIDRARRVEGESWWPEETITETEFKRALSAKGPIHVLVTHDAPTFPPGFTPKGSPSYQHDQLFSMKCVDTIIKKHRPMLHVHGHWHTRATTRQGTTRIEALDCNQLDPTYLDDSTLLWSRDQETT